MTQDGCLAAGFVDTKKRCFVKPEVGDGETEIQSGVQRRGDSACLGARGQRRADGSGSRTARICLASVNERIWRPIRPRLPMARGSLVRRKSSGCVVRWPNCERSATSQKRPRPSSRGKRREVRSCREASERLAGGTALRSAGRAPVGLPRLAASRAERPGPSDRAPNPG